MRYVWLCPYACASLPYAQVSAVSHSMIIYRYLFEILLQFSRNTG